MAHNTTQHFFFFFPSHFYFPVSGQALVTGVVPSPPRSLPSMFIAHRVQQSHCSSIFDRMLLSHALAFSASQIVHKEKSPRIHTRRHSGGFELTKLTYTRLEDNLIRHRGDRYTTSPVHNTQRTTQPAPTAPASCRNSSPAQLSATAYIRSVTKATKGIHRVNRPLPGPYKRQRKCWGNLDQARLANIRRIAQRDDEACENLSRETHSRTAVANRLREPPIAAHLRRAFAALSWRSRGAFAVPSRLILGAFCGTFDASNGRGAPFFF